MAGKTKWTGWHTFVLLAALVAIVLLGLLIPLQRRLWSWLGTLILLIVFTTIAGHGITGLWRGLLIDERNKVSLSRLQMILWTIVVLSGFLTAALANIAAGQASPLSIAIPAELWLLMGISTTSLVGSPLIKSTKTAKKPNEAERTSTFNLMAKEGVDTKKLASKGQIVVNTALEKARWSDLFKGEESGNAAQLDLSKVQMFFFTLILVIAYGAAIGTAFTGTAPKFDSFPALHSGMVALLGISHGGYLVHKAVPHSQIA
jgi:hypothetical protein